MAIELPASVAASAAAASANGDMTRYLSILLASLGFLGKDAVNVSNGQHITSVVYLCWAD